MNQPVTVKEFLDTLRNIGADKREIARVLDALDANEMSAVSEAARLIYDEVEVRLL